MSFGTTPVSTTSLGSNQFPCSAVYVQGTSGGNFTALQGGPVSSADSNGNVSAPAAMYVPDGNDVTLGTTTDLSSANTAIGILKAIKANTASVVIGSGTVTANQGGSWSVTANVGTTGGIALDTSVNGLLVAQGSTTSGEKGPLVQGAVTTAAPTYTTAQTSPLSLTTAGALRVDASATTQPVSGTVSVNALPAGSNTIGGVKLIDTGGTNVASISAAGAVKVDGSAVTQPVSGTFWQATQPVSGTVTANVGTTNGLALDATVAKLNVAQGAALGSNTGPMLQGSVTTGAPTYTTGNINPISLTTAGAVRVDGSAVTQPVSGTFWQATQPVSGTVTANIGTTNGLALDSSVNGVIVSQGSTTSGEKGPLIQGAVTTSVPSYTTAQTSPLSLDTSGLLRASLKDTPSNTNNFNVNLAASAATVTVTVGSALPTGANTIGAVTQASGPWTSNITQFGGSNVVTGTGASGSGIPRVTVSNDSNVLATQSGTWTVQPGNTPNSTAWLVQNVVGTTGGSTPSHVISGASNNATSLKASAGMVYGYTFSNTNAAARYVKLYNKASAPAPATDNALIVNTVQVPANATVIAAIPEGMSFSTGIAFAAVANMSDTDNTSIGAGDLSIDIRYK